MVQENVKLQSTGESEEEFYARTGVPERDKSGDIWMTEVDQRSTRNITGGEGSNWEPVWSPNGRYLAFLSNRDGSGQAKLWVWDARNARLRRVSDCFVRANYLLNGILWTPDSGAVVITTVPSELSLAAYLSKTSGQSLSQPVMGTGAAGSTVVVYEGGLGSRENQNGAMDAISNLDLQYLHDLVLIEIESGRVTSIVRNRRVGWYRLSPNGKDLAYVVPKKVGANGPWHPILSDLIAIDLRTMQEKVLGNDIALDGFSWSPDGALLAYGAYGKSQDSYDFYVVAPDTRTTRRVSSLPHQPYCCRMRIPAWDRGGDSFYFVLNGALWKASLAESKTYPVSRIPERSIEFRIWDPRGWLWTVDDGQATIVVAHDDERKQDGFYKINLATGSSIRLLENGHCYSCKWPVDTGSFLTAVGENGERIVYMSENAHDPPDLWMSDSRFAEQRQITRLNPQLEGYQMGMGTIVEWMGNDGGRLRGALLLPARYERGKKYPLVVWVYPGVPLSNMLDHFGFGEYPGPFDFQLLATRGYAVLLPDAQELTPDRMSGLANSVLPGINKVVEMGIADPERTAVMGHSQGGYAVLALLVETRRFKAAIAVDGWSDFTAYYGAMRADGSSYQSSQAERQLGGPPWQYPLRYIQNSPLYYLDRVETPVLIVHGAEDDAHPAFLGTEAFIALRRLGKRVEFAKYEGEGHVPGDWGFRNQVDLANRMIRWLDQCLKETPVP